MRHSADTISQQEQAVHDERRASPDHAIVSNFMARRERDLNLRRGCVRRTESAESLPFPLPASRVRNRLIGWTFLVVEPASLREMALAQPPRFGH